MRLGPLRLAVACAALVVACGGDTDQRTRTTAPSQTTPSISEAAAEPPPDGSSPGEAPEQPLEAAALSDANESDTKEGDVIETVESEPSAASGTSDSEENQAPTLTTAVASQELVVGEAIRRSLRLHFDDPDGDPLRYRASSSDEAVATVSVSGDTIQITGVAEGAATVTVTVHDPQGQSVEEAFEVSVENAVLSLGLSGVSTLNAIGEVTEFSAVAGFADGTHGVVDGSLVGWGSSDVAVVTVAEGAVTAVAGGIATVTATYEGQSAQLSVSVPVVVQEPGTVRVLYARPADREFRSDYSEAIERAMLGVQSWYRRQLNGLTFSLYNAVPQECHMGQPSDFYSQHTWEKVVDSVQHCAPVTAGTGDFTWVIYADVMDGCGPWELGFEHLGRGAIGLTILSRRDLFGLVDEDADYQRCSPRHAHGPEYPYGRWEGGLAHELGHTLSLVHPPGCDAGAANCDRRAMIASGWTHYPDTYLRFDDKETLLRSPFIDGAPPSAGEAPAGRGPAARGRVVDPDGVPVEGVRLSLSVEPFWSWTQTGTDGAFEITLPAAVSGSAAVSVHAGQAADCHWLGYHAPGGLTTARTDATEVPVRAGETTAVTIELPARPDKLCDRPRTLRVTVREADGTTAKGIRVLAFGRFATIEPSSTFEVPLHDVWSVPSILSIYDEALDCGLLGYFGSGGEFTTRRDDAAQFEVGAAAAELELPASRRDLCDAQELISGTVQWPNGKPAAGIWLFAEAVRTWSRVGADGKFTIRKPPGSPPTVVIVHADHVADCSLVGYLGPDRLVALRDDATPAQAGAGVTITLPVEADELCRWWTEEIATDR